MIGDRTGTMGIKSYLIAQRWDLIRRHKLGFGRNPESIPQPGLVSRLKELRQEEFLQFRKGLLEDGVAMFKILTAIDLPPLQEGLLIMNLRGDAQVVNLTEISGMTDEERKNNEYLRDLGTLFLDPKTFKIVNGVDDLLKFGGRVHVPIKAEEFVELRSWEPLLKDGFMNTIKLEYPGRYDALTLKFRGEKTYGWKWNEEPELFNEEQTRLLYALTSSFRSIALDGIIERTFGQPMEWLPVERLGGELNENLTEEVILDLEGRNLKDLDISKENDAADGGALQGTRKKVRFQMFNGITIAESLAYGLQRGVGITHLLDKPSRGLSPQRRHIHDHVEWEESLEMLHVVPAMPLVWEEVVFKKAGRSCLKRFNRQKIKYDYNYSPDPDINDRGHVRFPNLVTSKRVGTSRTASPPPRPDDPDGLRLENRRRRQGLRALGPPCLPGRPEDRDFVRNLEWEKTLPDDAGQPFGDAAKSVSKKRPGSPNADSANKKANNNKMETKKPRETGKTGASGINPGSGAQGREDREGDGNQWRGRGRGRGQRGAGSRGYRPRGPGKRGWRKGRW